jgi:hypothetical protein
VLLVLLIGLLTPVVYFLVIYKQLERRGEIVNDSAREQGKR